MEETEKELRTIETFDGQSMTIEELLKKLDVKPSEVTIHFKNGTLVSYTKRVNKRCRLVSYSSRS